MYKNLFKFSLLILLAFISIGCSSLQDRGKPKTIQDENNILQDKEQIDSLDEIKGFKNITQGIIRDISSNSNNIIILREDNIDPDVQVDGEVSQSLALYNISNEKIQSITSSPFNIILGRYDAMEEGVYYMENKEDSIYQLYWFDIIENKKIRISPKDHQVSPSFFVKQNNEIFYGTMDGKIFKAFKDKVSNVIDIGDEYYIQQIYYFEGRKLILFSAFNEEQLNLYALDTKGNSLTEVVSNINGHFNVSQNEDSVIYTTPIIDSNKSNLCLFKIGESESTNLIEGYPQKATLSPNGDRVIYLDKPDSNSDLLNLWTLNIKKQEKRQVASNLKVTSEFFWHPRGKKVFFSTNENRDGQIQSYVYSLDF